MNEPKKRIVIGVTGSIAAYKACDIIRELLRKQIDVRVVMSPEAHKFVSATTFAALSRNPVATDLFSSQEYGPIPHCELAKQMDLLLIAPATAHTIAKFAYGFADDLLSALFLAAHSYPILIAPAMNPNMYSHPMVQANIEALKKIGVFFVDPVRAEVACGEKGQGHLASIDHICEIVEEILYKKDSFQGRSFLITAGPTQEFIDPVRFISNKSSGKMGYALARAVQKRGAKVTLVSGPSALCPPHGVRFIPVITADEMRSEVEKEFQNTDVVIMAAAIADFRPCNIKSTKIKKEKGITEIRLEKTADILAELGAKKGKGQILVGFAAEDQDLVQNATLKLRLKNLDLIVANDISVPGVGFEADTNQVTLIHQSGEQKSLPKAEKLWIAEKILDEIEGMLN